MPTYEYRCLTCSHQFERFQRMSDEPVEECEACGEPVKRLLFPVAIHFKGSGFYTTDYANRKGIAAATGANTANGGASPSESSAESSGTSESTPKSSESTNSNASSGESAAAKKADTPVKAASTSAKKD